MKAVLNAREMSKLDDTTINYFRVPSEVLMERAALSVIAAIEGEGVELSDALIICGSGNNGGDGFAIARILAERDISCSVLFTGKKDYSTMSREARLEKDICLKYDVPVLNLEGFSWSEDASPVIIDAMFGIGLNRPLDDKNSDIVNSINEAKEEGAYVVSVDIPSGIAADTGKVMGAAVKADLTVTFAYKKLGHVLYPGADHTGKLVCADIGITERAFLQSKPECVSIEDKDLPCIQRKPYSNKGTYGKVLIAAGSKDIGGCALLATRAAFMTGAGMVRVLTHKDNRDLILNSCPEAMVDTYEYFLDEDKLLAAMEWADVLAIGPGVTKSRLAGQMLECFINKSDKPLIIDADAIYLLKEHEEYLLKNHVRKIVITPHIMEMAGFLEVEKNVILDDIVHAARSVADRFKLICVLKDARTIITRPSAGYRINLSGNDGMASAGMGDTLFGIIAGLLAQGMDAFEAASFGAFIHGHAADLAVKDTGKSGLTASDVIDHLKECFE